MPRLVKGGKFVYGLSRISPQGGIFIPPAAMKEYAFSKGDKVVVMSGSRRSGGFGLTKKEIVAKSELSGLIETLSGLWDCRIPREETVENQGRLFCWTEIQDGGFISLPREALAGYGCKPGDLLAVGKGSYLALAFIARGPIMEEALKHPELEVFEV
jgi:hypothetical protein